MTSALDASIVPITLTVNGRTGLTLWAPPWEDEDGEEWQGFLGDGAKILLFPTARDLADFIASGEDNDLSDHPGWGRVLRLTPDELGPGEDDRYDLDEVYELAAGEPDPVHISRLANTVDMVEKIADCCDDGALRRLVGGTPAYAELVQDEVSYTGREGRKNWSELGDTIAESWERALTRVESWLNWRGDFPEPDTTDTADTADTAATADAAGSSGATASSATTATTRTGDDLDGAADDQDTTAAADGAAFGSPWERIEAEPITIVLPKARYLTMRGELDGQALFLGGDRTVAVFDDVADLARYARTGRQHALTRLQWWDEVADIEDAEFRPATDASYDLRKPNPAGVQLLRELAHFCDLDADLADLGDPDDPGARVGRGVFAEIRDEVVTCLQRED